MIDGTPESQETAGAGGKTRKAQYAILGAVCVLVIGVYAWSCQPGWELLGLDAANTRYNLLVRGFQAGQLNLKAEVPPGLAQLADPYDPTANAPFRWSEQYPLEDLSYYQGKLYLYFGVTPALLLFWPWHELSGHYLLHKDAVLIFCAVGFLASAGLLAALWQRYFARVSYRAVAACILALGLVTGTPMLLARADVYEVAIGCGYALTMVTLALIWKALHDSRRRGWWLAGASLAYGLAVGARPSLLFGAVILLAPVVLAWRRRAEPDQRRRVWILLVAATVPIMLIGLGLMLYNFLRFDNLFEFGQRYQLSGARQDRIQHFSLGYAWFNFRVYFLEPARWSMRFPFVHGVRLPHLPAGHAGVEQPFGVLANLPLVWLAFTAPLVWRGQLGEARSVLRYFGVVLALLFGICELTLVLYGYAMARYEVEFLSPLLLLAVIGILGVEAALAGRPVWRRATRCGWGLLLVFSVAFNWFARFELYSQTRCSIGLKVLYQGRVDEAVAHFRKALEFQPSSVTALMNLGKVLLQQGKVSEAMEYLEHAVLAGPDDADAHNDLGTALFQQGKVPEAMGHYEQALRIKPNFAEGHYNLGTALMRQDNVPEAIRHLEQGLQFRPDFAEAHNSLGVALFQQGKVPEAIGHYEQALWLRPDHAAARNNLEIALFRLAEGLTAQGKLNEAIQQYQRAVEMKPDNAQAHDRLGLALSRVGRFAEAVRTAETALALAQAAGQAEQARQIQERLQLYQAGRPYQAEPAPGR